jgi:molecular chaperone DnaK (HSP70)
VREKIYGIDLGTTYSVIGYKDTLLSPLVPSVAMLEEKKAGEEFVENVNAERSFKINISLGIEGNMPIVASSLVLKTLKEKSGQDVKKAVVAVPAYFSDDQRQATIKAAKLAGLEVAGLINEPTAAAIYLSKGRKALSLIYDLGGGTFDVSVIDSRFGAYDIQATDGFVVGGDNFDAVIARSLIKAGGIARHRLGKQGFARLTRLAAKVKIRMQKERKDLEVDLREFGAGIAIFKEEDYIKLMRVTFADTIIKARKVVNEAIPFGEDFDIIMVGGSTRCPYLREWIAKELGREPLELDYDPDLAVAQGAASYAYLLETEDAVKLVSDVTKALSVGLADGTVTTIIQNNSKIPIEESTCLYNSEESDTLRVRLYQGDALLESMNEFIGTLAYKYDKVQAPGAGEVIVKVKVDISGVITLSCGELLKEPAEIVLDRKTVTA